MKKGKNYYESIISKMGSDIKTTQEMYDIINATNAEFGLKLVQQISTQLNELCKVLGDSISEALDNDTKKKGRQIPKLFVLNSEKARKAVQGLRDENKEVKKQAKLPQKVVRRLEEPVAVEKERTHKIKFSRQYSAVQDAIIEDYLKYLVVSIIAREGKSTNIAAIMKVLREKVGSKYHNITKQDLLNIVESEKNVLSLSNDKQSICYSNKEILLGCVERCHPKNKKYTIHARISMTAHEITNKFGLAVNLVSSISENEGIYEIFMDRSFNTFLKLLNLYRTFRGTDMIIGSNEIVEELEVQKSRTDGLFRNNTFTYQLEKPIE